MSISDLKTRTRLAMGELMNRFLGGVSSLQSATPSRTLDLSELEERILLSASPVVMVAELGAGASVDSMPAHTAMLDPETSFFSAPAATSSAGPSDEKVAADPSQVATRELVFLDTSAEGYQMLRDNLWANDDSSREIEVVMLQESRDGVDQITEALAKRSDLDAVHIVSDGTDRAMKLGSTWLSQESLPGHAGDLARWGHSLSGGADLLFYGCDLAVSDDGQDLLESVQLLTGADVAASVDKTGAAIRGSDWDLEYEPGRQKENDFLSTTLAFEENLEQPQEADDLLARGRGYTVFLSDGDAVLSLTNGDTDYAVRLHLEGGDSAATVVGQGKIASHLIGDRSEWQTDAASFNQVRFSDVYEGIDVAYYGNERHFEYDFVVEAGADAGQIQLNFDGAEGLYIDGNGELAILLSIDGDEIRFHAPFSYQETEAGRQTVVSRYRMNADGTVGFELGDYDASRELVIAPILNNEEHSGDHGAVSGESPEIKESVDDASAGSASDEPATLSGEATAVPAAYSTKSTELPSGNATDQSQVASHEIVFLDSSVDDYQQLLDDLWLNDDPLRQFDVVLLDRSRDGIEQISEALAGRSDLDAVHVVSHGTDTAVKLGSTWLTAENLSGYTGEIASWGSALSTDADLLFYGCDLAASSDGQLLVDSISTLTGADVAASTDDTGHAIFGANWELEYSTGVIDASVPFSTALQSDWNGLLNTFVVTTTADSGAGSLRQAIADANALGGVDTITFNIGRSDAGHFYYRDNGDAGFSAPVTTTLADAAITDFDTDYPADLARSWYRIQTTSELLITDAVIIDGTTQPGYIAGAPVIEIDAAGVGGSDPNAITLQAGNSTIRGLVINRAGDDAIELEINGGNTIECNYIGTDVSGTLDRGNEYGIAVKSSNNTIGGTAAAQRNIVSGNFDFGVGIYNSATGNSIHGNYVGLDVTGTQAIGNGSYGVDIFGGAFSNVIGGIGEGEGNRIAYSTLDGVSLDSSGSTGNAIRGNTIYANGGLGIDLVDDGVTSNDSGDGDSGENNLQNFPELSSALTNGTSVTIDGLLNSISSTTFEIDFYASVVQDGSGHGEAERYLGSATVMTDAIGNVSFSENFVASVMAGEFITATTTDPSGNTSEFALNVASTFFNSAPTITTIADQTPLEDTATGAIAFTIGDAETAVGSLIVTASSDDQTLIPNANITLGGSGANRTINIHSGTNQNGGPATITVSVLDGIDTAQATFDVTVTPDNDAPVLSGIESSNLQYDENDGPVTVTTSLSLSDVDDANIESATIQLTFGYISTEDVLDFTDTASITGSWDEPSGLLTLTGADTVAAYQAALRSVTYENTIDNPMSGLRNVILQVNDGSINSNSALRTISLTPINDHPVITSGGSAATAELSVAENSTFVTTVTSSDVDGELL